ncbi:MAG: TetR/AcrR family transcriptional regulator [Parasphingopyxis sp.]|uniref:TetR/AcrR family transcriptional regulator n=1 Tax=Parasphingopyxis sp. TaxID=1920299 RepID=UPI003F9FA902
MLDIEPQKRERDVAAAQLDWRERRRTIVGKVVDLYLAKPWPNISIEAVAEHAGMSFWQAYYAFDGQEDVYRAVVGRLIAGVEKTIRTAPSDTDTVRGTIADYIDWAAKLFLRADYRNLVFLEMRDGPSEPWLVMNIDSKIRRPLRTSLERRIIAAGERHGLSLVCESAAITRSLTVLEANTALVGLLAHGCVEDRAIEAEKRKAVTEIWRATRSAESVF